MAKLIPSHVGMPVQYKYIILKLTGVVACWTAPQVIRLFNFLIDNIYIQVGLSVFQQAIGIPMGTDCAPLIADLFLSSSTLTFLWLGDSIKPLGI